MENYKYNHLFSKIIITGTNLVHLVRILYFYWIAIESAIEDNVTLLEASVDLNLASFFDRKVEKIIEITPHLKEKPQIDFRPELGINKD